MESKTTKQLNLKEFVKQLQKPKYVTKQATGLDLPLTRTIIGTERHT